MYGVSHYLRSDEFGDWDSQLQSLYDSATAFIRMIRCSTPLPGRSGITSLKHKEPLFDHLRQRWQDLFGARFEVLLYDLTSTYFESDPAFEGTDKRQFGYSRDKRWVLQQGDIAKSESSSKAARRNAAE